MKTYETYIEYNGIELYIKYDWVDGYPATLETPEEHPDVEYVNEVIHNGEDIIDMLSDEIIEEIREVTYQTVIEKHN